MQIVPYDDSWPQLFNKELLKIKQALTENYIQAYHIGSTAVPGLVSKNVIDILCVVNNLKFDYLEICKLGYLCKGEYNIPNRLFFSTREETPKYHLHITENDHSFVSSNLHFRDYLRHNEKTCKAYARLKIDLDKDNNNSNKADNGFNHYNLKKNNFIKSILRKSGFNDFIINHCLHEQEWKEYHRLKICGQHVVKPQIIKYNCDNHFHIVLYKGAEIVCAASIEFTKQSKAIIGFMAIDQIHQAQRLDKIMIILIQKWLKHHARTIL